MRVRIVGGISCDLLIAINAALPEGCEAIALNVELAADGSVPTELELLPPGQIITGRDGRTWINDAPDEIVAGFATGGRDIPIDWEHATEIRAPNGDQAPAAGWIKGLEKRAEGSIYGVGIEWTPKGRESVANREYRYLSPVFVFDRNSNRICKILSVGLTNRPNLFIPALNREHNKEEAPMLKRLLILLGLPETTNEEAALNHVGTLKGDLATALNRAESPSLDKFVPRADYDKALNRATEAEKTLASQKKEELEKAINTEIDQALKDGKITPATKEYHVAQCRQEGGLERFKEFAKAAPVIAADSGLDGKKLAGDDKALNAEEQKVADMFGNSADDIKKYGSA